MPPAQQLLGANAQGNTQKLIRERKLKAEALRTAAASTHKTSEDLALRLDEHVAAVTAGAREVAKFEAHITATKTVIGKLEAKATSALASPELTAFLGKPRAVYAAAGRLPDDVVQSLLPLLTAYLDTQDPDVIIACSQPVPEEDLVDTAAQLQTLRVEHEGEIQSLEKTMQSLEQTLQSRERTIESREQTIQALEQTIHGLQADLAAAKPLAAAVPALTKERDAALATIQTLQSNLNAVEAVAESVPALIKERKTLQADLAAAKTVAASVPVLTEERETLQANLAAVEAVAASVPALTKERDTLQADLVAAQALAASVTRLTEQRDTLTAQVSSLQRLVAQETNQRTALLGENQTLVAKVAEADSKLLAEAGRLSSLRQLVARESDQRAALSDENKILTAKLAESDSKLLAESGRTARFELEIQGHVESAAAQARDAQQLSLELRLARDAHTALQALLAAAEMEGTTFRADARQLGLELDGARDSNRALQTRLTAAELDAIALRATVRQHAENVEAEAARAQAAMGEVERICTEHNKALSAARAQRDEVVCALRAEVVSARQLCQTGKEDVDRLSALVQDAQAEKRQLAAKAATEAAALREEVDRLSALVRGVQAEKRELTGKVQAAADRTKSLQQQLEQDSQAHAESLRASAAEKDALATSLASHQGQVRLLEEQALVAADRIQSLQQQLEQDSQAHAESLRVSVAEKDALAMSLASQQDRVHLLEAQVASVHASLEQVESDLAAENGHVQRLCRDSQASLHSLALHLSAGAAGVPEASWVAFAHAVQTPKTSLAAGPAPLLWTLDVWDLQDEPVVAAPDMSKLYAALCTDDWSAQLLAQALLVTAELAQADSINTAVISLLVEEAVRSLAALDPATPVACASGLGICQLLAVLRARWPDLSVPADVARRLALPVVDLVGGGDLGPSPDRLECGPLSLLSRQDSPVGFVVDAERRCIRAVAKTRCGWAGKTSVRIQAPRGPDLTIQIDSDTTFQWLFFHWVC